MKCRCVSLLFHQQARSESDPSYTSTGTSLAFWGRCRGLLLLQSAQSQPMTLSNNMSRRERKWAWCPQGLHQPYRWVCRLSMRLCKSGLAIVITWLQPLVPLFGFKSILIPSCDLPLSSEILVRFTLLTSWVC